MSESSLSPAGERFPLPEPNEYAAEFERLEKRVAEARAEPGPTARRSWS
jgi:hypothetical protein